MNESPQIIILGDSLIRSVIIPQAITYCLPGGKVHNLIELTPIILDRHPTASILIFHVGSNDVSNRNSIKLMDELKSLATTVQSLGKSCIFSGPIPAPSKSAEHFSRLVSLHEWQKAFCTENDMGFVNNFDSFWTQKHLYKKDGLHPSPQGTNLLIIHYINFIAFSHK